MSQTFIKLYDLHTKSGEMHGKVEWISIRPERKAAVVPVDKVQATTEAGLHGDHDTQSHRQVTLIAQEALDAVARQLGKDAIDPAKTRRNIVISGLAFDQLDNAEIRIGEALVEVTGICHPCQLMDQNLGDGGRTAMEGYMAGLTARVLKTGLIAIGDDVSV